MNLQLGHVRVEVRDAGGALLDPAGVNVYAFPAGQHDSAVASSYGANPADLPVRGGASVDLELHYDDKTLTFPAQSAPEGGTLMLRATAGDFK